MPCVPATQARHLLLQPIESLMFSRSQPLNVGDTAPGFALETAYGVEVSLTSCIVGGPLLVEFLRGSWDPDSRARLRMLTEFHPKLAELGCKVVTIVCERTVTLAHYLEQNGTPFPVLVDTDRNVSKAYGVWQRFSLPVWNIARPSSFLLDHCGYVVYSYVARLPIHAADLEEIEASARDLQRGRASF